MRIIIFFIGAVICSCCSCIGSSMHESKEKDSLSVDSSVFEFTKDDMANIKQIEEKYGLSVLEYGDVDTVSGYRIVFLHTPESRDTVVNHVVLTDSNNNIVYIVKSVLRDECHDMFDDEAENGFYVIGRDSKGAVRIGNGEYFFVEDFVRNIMPHWENNTDITYTTTLESFSPFTPLAAEDKLSDAYKRFFSK